GSSPSAHPACPPATSPSRSRCRRCDRPAISSNERFAGLRRHRRSGGRSKRHGEVWVATAATGVTSIDARADAFRGLLEADLLRYYRIAAAMLGDVVEAREGVPDAR